MLTRSELVVDQVTVEMVTVRGDRVSVQTRRTRGNRLSMTCTCEDHRRDGWCRDQIDLLCLRYDRIADRDQDVELQFEDLVIGTAAADLADEVDLALTDFEAASAALMKASLRDLSAPELRRTGDLAANLSETARQLDEAIARFKRRLSAPES